VYALKFLKEFITKPGVVGSVTPSSKQLASQVVESAKVPQASVVVEFGPGTGAITEMIVPNLRPGAKCIAMEINSDFVKLLRERFPSITVHEDSAANTPKHLKELGVDHCDSIVSGLPWAFFSESLQNDLLDGAVEALRPGGIFATYIYVTSYPMPSSLKFRNKLKARFSEVGMTRVIWANVPPAIVVWARK
jgi:phospholipid N-methyltransferase